MSDSNEVEVIFHFISSDSVKLSIKKETLNSIIEKTDDTWDITIKNNAAVINMMHVTYYEILV